MENKFLVLNINDAKDCLSPRQMENAKELIATITDYRTEIGKVAAPQYYVVNALEPYAERVRDIVEGYKDKTETYSEQFENILKTIQELHENGINVKAFLGVVGEEVEIRITGTIKKD